MFLERKGLETFPRVNRMRRYILSVVDFGLGQPGIWKGPTSSASYFAWACTDQKPYLPDSILYGGDGIFRLGPPTTVSAFKAVSPGGAMNRCPSGPGKIAMKLHVRWKRASSLRLNRILADLDWAACIWRTLWAKFRNNVRVVGPGIRFRANQLRERPWYRSSMGNYESVSRL